MLFGDKIHCFVTNRFVYLLCSKLSMERILITDAVHPLLIEKFRGLGYEVDYQPDILYEEVKDIIDQYVGLIINSKILVDKEFIDKSTKLIFIGRLGSGMEIINQVYAKEKGIAVFNSPEGNRNAVAEHAFAMLLALNNHLIQADKEVKAGIWNREENRGFELEGKTIGIIGYGHTGKSFSAKFCGWNTKLLVHDKYLNSFTDLNLNLHEASKEQIIAEADIISLHLPLTVETLHYVNEEFLSRMKKNAVLINTSRGKIINTKDLVKILDEGHLRGVCLDVFENENPKIYTGEEKKLYAQLLNFKNIIATPHVAGWTFESKEKLSMVLFEKIKSFLDNLNQGLSK